MVVWVREDEASRVSEKEGLPQHFCPRELRFGPEGKGEKDQRGSDPARRMYRKTSGTKDVLMVQTMWPKALSKERWKSGTATNSSHQEIRQ